MTAPRPAARPTFVLCKQCRLQFVLERSHYQLVATGVPGIREAGVMCPNGCWSHAAFRNDDLDHHAFLLQDLHASGAPAKTLKLAHSRYERRFFAFQNKAAVLVRAHRQKTGSPGPGARWLLPELQG